MRALLSCGWRCYRSVFMVERGIGSGDLGETTLPPPPTAGVLPAVARAAPSDRSDGAPFAAQDPWLRLIAGLKVAKGTFLLVAAIAALGLMSQGTARPISRWAMEIAADRHYEVATTLVAKILSVEPRTLRLLSAGSLLYSVLFYTEGFGLLFDKRWAKYMTIFTTGGLIPFELFEVFRRASWTKGAVLVANVAIVAYLVWRVRDESVRGERHA